MFFSSRWRQNSLVFAVVLVVHMCALGVKANNCTQHDADQMQANFTKCTGEATRRYQTRLETEDKEVATCQLFHDIIHDCCEIWQLCHTDDDISEIKSMQMLALLGQYVDSNIVNLEDCQLTNDYWDKMEEEVEEPEGKCTDKQYVEIQTKFQTCSHEISTTVYQSFYEVKEGGEVATLVCEALVNITESCPDLLKECFAPNDVRQMLKMHLKEIKNYLIGLTAIKLTAENNVTVDTCPPLVPKEGEEEWEYLDDDYYEDEGDETDQIQEDLSNNIQDLLTEHKAESPSDQPLADTPANKQTGKLTDKKPTSATVKSLDNSCDRISTSVAVIISIFIAFNQPT